MRYPVRLFLVSIFTVYIACAPSVNVPVAIHWYQPLSLSQPPAVSLAGKKILIDPGHGNASSGAVGINGTKEKDVNFKVACILKKLLENQGATVYMTRISDTAGWWSVNFTNREDLDKRRALRDSLCPDLFLSIHHNGSDNGSPDTNGSKTYYAMGDAGASLDAAQYINREFTELLGLGKSLLLSGNFYILRNTKVPAVLGEPCYLSNPVMERLLCDTASLKLEATAYFRGIIRWFSAGVPKITGFTIDSANGMVTAIVKSETRLDTQFTNIFLDETRLNGKICENGYTAGFNPPLKNECHNVKCTAGNINGNLSTCAELSFIVDRPVKTLISSVENTPVLNSARLFITALDRYGYPVRNGTRILLGKQSVAYTENGVARFYIPVADTAKTVDISCGGVTIHPFIPEGFHRLPDIQGFISSSDTNFKISTGIISIGDTNYSTDQNGFFSIELFDTGLQMQASFCAPGFINSAAALYRNKINQIKLYPRAQGILIGKRIVIDPEFGGAEPGGLNNYGVRACDLTRKLSLELEGLLRQHGADVHLTREDDRTIHVTERVALSEKYSAEVYLIIRSDSIQKVPYVSYLPGSRLGEKISEKISFEWNQITGNSASICEESAYVMRQTRCPSAVISLSPINIEKLFESNLYKKIAVVVLNGLIDYYKETSRFAD
jgi:N-acetylmuramoyl-L-alanine amidase